MVRVTDLPGKVRIAIYANDTNQHKEPHFHADSPDEDAVVSIRTMTQLAGDMKGKKLRNIREWGTENKEHLEQEWNRLNPHFPV